MGEERLVRKIYEAKEEGERKRIRPRKTWMKEVRKDMR